MKVGFLGLGGMGAAMATRLVQAGLEVTVWNRSAAACEPLVALGAARAEEVGELFGLDVVISMLADDQAIRGVLLDSGALERARPGLIHLSMSTLSLDCVRRSTRRTSARASRSSPRRCSAAPTWRRPAS